MLQEDVIGMHQDMYVPVKAAVLAMQWDGADWTLSKLQVFGSLVGHTFGVNQHGRLLISVDADQRGDYIPLEVGSWITFGGKNQSQVSVYTNAEFTQQFMQMPTAGAK